MNYHSIYAFTVNTLTSISLPAPAHHSTSLYYLLECKLTREKDSRQ
jgi:hypothetical protein